MVFEYDQSLLSYDPQDVDSMFSTSSMFYDLSQAEQNIDASAGNFGEGGSGPEVDIQDAQAAAWAESVQQDDSSHSAADAQLLYQEGIGLEWPAPQGHLEQEVLHTDPCQSPASRRQILKRRLPPSTEMSITSILQMHRLLCIGTRIKLIIQVTLIRTKLLQSNP